MPELKTKFCPKCGREADRLYDGMCVGCFFEKHSIEVPERVVVKRCKYCGKYFLGRTAYSRLEDVINNELKKILGAEKSVTMKMGIKSINYRVANGKAHVSLKFDFEGIQKSEEHQIKIDERAMTCEQCALAGAHYYNAILQIRVPDKIMDAVLNEVRKRVESMKSDRLAFITDVNSVKGGVDVYIGSKGAANRIARAIKDKFGAHLTNTRKIGGAKDGKNVYRDTILILIE